MRLATPPLLAVFAALALAPAPLPAQEVELPGPLPGGEVRLPNGRTLAPAGEQTVVGPYPFAVAVTPDGGRIVVASMGVRDQKLQLIDAASGRIVAEAPVTRSWLGLAVSPDGRRVYLSGAKDRVVRRYRLAGDSLAPNGEIPVEVPGDHATDALPGGLALSADGGTLWVARTLADDVARVDVARGRVSATIPVGRRPYRPVLSPDGRLVAVAAWGAASVTLIDARTSAPVATIGTADHPCDLAFSADGRLLFVAQANRNLVAVVDVERRRVVRQVSVAMGAGGPGTPSADALPDGSTPNALAVAPDGRRLYVANADDDAVAVVDLGGGDPERIRTAGFIPTGWYPAALALTPDGRTLVVANAKGGGSISNRVGGPSVLDAADARPPRSTRTIPGSVSRIAVPDAGGLAALTRRAYDDRKPAARGASPARTSRVVPTEPGPRSPIEHVVYVIRENRTYDQVLGDVPRGNGDPSLAILGAEVTPNVHALVDEFVLLDNFYADAEVSADGHNWSTAAYATDFVEKTWVPNYGHMGFRYDFEGDDPIAAPTAGYLWDAAVRAGRSVRNYGEFVGVGTEAGEETFTGRWEGKGETLRSRTCSFYPGFDLGILDNARVDLFLKEFRSFVKKGDLPALTIVRLGNDHTLGTRKGAWTPRAMVAENDVALGRLVEEISESPFWPTTAIFVVEDDAQNGSDHVDAHRTIALVVSPFTRRGGAVDSTLYSTTSMLRTMELILGLPPLSQHDAAATPMTNAFADAPDPTPFRHRPARVDLFERNLPGAPMQAESGTWDFDEEDRAPEIPLNEAIWKSIRGADADMPPPVNASFVHPIRRD